MPKVILTKGLPASGKTTWAKLEQKKDPNIVLVNKDELRAMLHQSIHSEGREKFVLKVRDFIIQEAVNEGHDVIVHDTNFSSKHESRISQLVHGKATVELKDFTDVPLEECIKRDIGRPGAVGEKVIRKMYKDFIAPKTPVVEVNPKLPDVILCDLDGTLCLFGDANPYDRDFTKDKVNKPVKKTLDSFLAKQVILVSGRNGKFRDQTEEWLEKNGIKYRELIMRAEGDVRKDVLVKQEMYENHIKGQYNVLFVLDDRDQVVEFWRSQGLTCFQVAEGDF